MPRYLVYLGYIKERSEDMKCLLLKQTAQTVHLWKRLFALILCIVMPSVSAAQLANTKISVFPRGLLMGCRFPLAQTAIGWGIGIEIYVMNAGGTNPVRLTNTPEVEFFSTWSPDGAKIAFE